MTYARIVCQRVWVWIFAVEVDGRCVWIGEGDAL